MSALPSGERRPYAGYAALERGNVVRIERARQKREHKPCASIIGAMVPESRFTYEMEGCLPIIQADGISLADEDYDPVPVPQGCHGCWKVFDPDVGRPTPCFSCPSPPSKQELREHRRCAPLLTPRERTVAELVVAGVHTPQIARKMGLEHSSIRKHKSSLYAKLSTDASGLPRALRALGVASAT